MLGPHAGHKVRYASALLVALLVVPLLARGMHHAHDAFAARACAVCTVAKHTPGVVPAAVATVAPVLLRVVFAPPALPPAIGADHHRHGGRAPPSPPTARTA
jgi:hypothetical protein